MRGRSSQIVTIEPNNAARHTLDRLRQIFPLAEEWLLVTHLRLKPTHHLQTTAAGEEAAGVMVASTVGVRGEVVGWRWGRWCRVPWVWGGEIVGWRQG